MCSQLAKVTYPGITSPLRSVSKLRDRSRLNLSMYEAFDEFLQAPTWYAKHADEDERFFCALATVVLNPRFNADSLGEYMDQKRAQMGSAQADLSQEAYQEARSRYVNAAWAVRRYLRYAQYGATLPR